MAAWPTARQDSPLVKNADRVFGTTSSYDFPVYFLDRCHACDFIARFCRTSRRLYCADSVADGATDKLHGATLSRKQTRLLRYFPVLRCSFTVTVTNL